MAEATQPLKKRRTKRAADLNAQAWYRTTGLFDLTDNDGVTKLAEALSNEAPTPADMAVISRLFFGLCRRLAVAENVGEAAKTATDAYQKLDSLPLTAADRGVNDKPVHGGINYA